jgi:hypothetical protein
MLVEQGIANPSGVLELLPGVHVARSLIDCVVICRYHCLSFCPFYFCHWSVCLSDFSVSPCNFAIKIVKMITEWINFQEGKNHYDHYLIHDDIWCGPTTLFMMTSGAVPLPYSWWHLVRSHSWSHLVRSHSWWHLVRSHYLIHDDIWCAPTRQLLIICMRTTCHWWSFFIVEMACAFLYFPLSQYIFIA